MTFKAGHQLQFLFHSDSSNTEWGYKFTVTAFGLPDISVSWISDLQLLVSRLMGRLASRTMALKSTHGTLVFLPDVSFIRWYGRVEAILELVQSNSPVPHANIRPLVCYFWWNIQLIAYFVLLFSSSEVHSVKELPAAVMNHVISSPLWKPLFTHGLSGPARSRELERCSDEAQQVHTPSITSKLT